MKRTPTFGKRCLKERLRDPLGIIFSGGLPLVLLFLMTAIRRSTGEDIFRPEDFGPQPLSLARRSSPCSPECPLPRIAAAPILRVCSPLP